MTGHDKGILNPGDRLIVSLEGTATEPSPRFGPNVSVSLHKSVTFNIINVEPLPEGYGMAQSMDIRLDSYTRQLTAKRTITLEVPPPADMRTDKLVLSLTIHVSSHCCMLCTQGFSWGEIVCEWEPMHGGFR
jgi:hypothetical protein